MCALSWLTVIASNGTVSPQRGSLAHMADLVKGCPDHGYLPHIIRDGSHNLLLSYTVCMGHENRLNTVKKPNKRPEAGVVATLVAIVVISLGTLSVLMLNCIGVLALDQEAACEQWVVSPIRATEVVEPVTITFVGDMMLGRDVESMSKRRGGYVYPFAETLDLLQTADITVGNLETPLTPGLTVPTEAMVFRADLEWAQALADAGFDVVGLANNHIPNQGSSGIQDTLDALDAAGLLYTGAGMDQAAAETPAIMTVKGMTIGMVAFNDSDVVPDGYFATDTRAGTAAMDISELITVITDVRAQVDFLVVMMHSGTEYQTTPNQRQIDFAHAAIDTGADLVIGHHPHVIQTVEEYQGKYIYYSLGNFIFDQMWSEPTRQGLVVTFSISKGGVEDVHEDHVRIYDYSQPRVE